MLVSSACSVHACDANRGHGAASVHPPTMRIEAVDQSIHACTACRFCYVFFTVCGADVRSD